jgi:acyl-CoA synthetase (AMP-forming)/AMP-acid ligase II
LVTDEIALNGDDRWQPPSICPDTVAFLQYTSGSTGTPRGVIVTHGNLMANERAIQAAFGHTQEDVVVGWLPVFHDMGLIGNVLQPLYVGFPSILFSPTSFLRDPVRWLRAISDYRGTTAGAPNFAYDHCVRSIKEEQKEGLDLRSWKVAYNGSEPVRAETLDRFTTAFAGCGFRKEAFFPCYGLAEATLLVSGGPLEVEPPRCWVQCDGLEAGKIIPVEPGRGRCLVASGLPPEGTKVVAVDPSIRMPVPDGSVGELWVSSPSVADGYWGEEKEASATFENYLASGGGPFLSTGDLGFLQSSKVFVTGRRKDILILRGRNVYPQDVESAVQSALPSLGANSCAAFAVERGRQEGLAVVVEADRELARVSRYLTDGQTDSTDSQTYHLWVVVDKVCQTVLADVEVAVQSLAFVRPGTFLRTSSGKVQRGATRTAFLEGSLDVIFAWDAGAPSRLTRTGPISLSNSVTGGVLWRLAN